ncbi:MAG TPA: SIS domain-containing protein [Rhodocyclaceae bacterium]
MELVQRVGRLFDDSLAVQSATRDALAPDLARAVEVLTATLLEGGKILVCGNGGSAAQAQHFACELIDCYETERQELAAINLCADTTLLTAIGNNHGQAQLFAKQINALGQAGDLLVVLSTSGNSESVIEAIHAAHRHELRVIALTGASGGRLAAILGDSDLLLAVPDDRTPRVQEAHQLMLHCLCDGVDALLLGLET